MFLILLLIPFAAIWLLFHNAEQKGPLISALLPVIGNAIVWICFAAMEFVLESVFGAKGQELENIRLFYGVLRAIGVLLALRYWWTSYMQLQDRIERETLRAAQLDVKNAEFTRLRLEREAKERGETVTNSAPVQKSMSYSATQDNAATKKKSESFKERARREQRIRRFKRAL